MSKIWLGIMLCMGNGLPLRDVKKGIKLIEEAKNLGDYGFIPSYALGKMYGEGYAQPDEIPSRGDFEKAIMYLNASIKLPQIQNIIQTMGQDIGQSLIEKAKEDLEEVKKKLANKIIEEENPAISSNTSLLNSLAEINRLKAIERRIKNMELPYEKQKQLNEYEAAIKQFRECLAIKILEKDSKNIDYLKSKGAVLRDLGKKEEAIECYDKALNLDPNNIDCLKSKGAILRDLGKKEEAIEYYDKVLNLVPNNIDYLIIKGVVLRDLGKKEEAIECYDKVLNLNPKNIDWLRCLRQIVALLEELDRKEEAILNCNKILARVPNDSYAINTKKRLEKNTRKQLENGRGCSVLFIIIIGVLVVSFMFFNLKN